MKKALLTVLVVAALAAAGWFAFRPVEVNLPEAPDVTMAVLEGGQIRLHDLRGKVVLVNFWATWCAPCRIEIPWFIEFQEKYGPQGFTVLGVAMDAEGARVVRPYVRDERFEVNGSERSINYPILLGNDNIEQAFGGLIGMPTSLLISRDGRIIKRFIGLVNHDYLVREIEAQM
jgi:thiol-disulfide isomerase/thioredoxin